MHTHKINFYSIYVYKSFLSMKLCCMSESVDRVNVIHLKIQFYFLIIIIIKIQFLIYDKKT